MNRASFVRRLLAMRCDEAAEMMSASLDEKLSRLDKFALRAHLLLCHSCCRFQKQLSFLRQAMGKASVNIEETKWKLSDECRTRIQKVINDSEVDDQHLQ